MKIVDPESRALLESAERLLISGQCDAREILLMVYSLGKMDGRMEQLDRNEKIMREHIDA